LEKRESLGSRLGFILVSAGCAVGLGNVWRFPYIVGEYGGAAFVIVYLFFLVILGIPIMTMEFSVGRASRKSVASSFKVLEPKGKKWHLFGYFGMAGNYMLMMFYTTVCGWMITYLYKFITGQFEGVTSTVSKQIFSDLQADPVTMTLFMVISVLIGILICSIGLKKGVERISKIMMSALLVIMVVLVVRSVTLPGASEGLSFYLKPDFTKMVEKGFGEAIFAAMGQAFFTLSIGIGSMAIFGSYTGKERRLLSESVNITILDTMIAVMAGLIIFPACFAFGISPDSGPNLIFITLPNVFAEMPGGQIWGSFFFLFMSFAAITTVVAVFENIISFAMDLWGWSRKKAAWINAIVVVVLSLPAVFGFNLLSGFQPLGAGSTILDLEDFIVSNNFLPLGALVYLMFCVSKYGWGWDNFLEEANTGKGFRFPKRTLVYAKYILPLLILGIFIQGYFAKFA